MREGFRESTVVGHLGKLTWNDTGRRDAEGNPFWLVLVIPTGMLFDFVPGCTLYAANNSLWEDFDGL